MCVTSVSLQPLPPLPCSTSSVIMALMGKFSRNQLSLDSKCGTEIGVGMLGAGEAIMT